MAAEVNGMLQKLLLQRGASSRLWTALTALCVGTTLLLVSVLIWWNFNELLQGRGDRDSLGSTFLTLSKRVTNERMGHADQTVFSPAEVEELKRIPGVEGIGTLLAVQDKVMMSMKVTGTLGFSTIMFLEAVPDAFMDKLPPDWNWQPGNVQVPIILSAEFLSLYNYVFAPSQGLPQLSEESIRALPFTITIGPDGHEENYIAHVAGFSDRITSVLVPQAFAQYTNAKSGQALPPPPSRLIIRIRDPSSTVFRDYLESHGYVTNAEQLRWSKMRAIVQVVVAATGVLALLLMGISVLVFVLFIELTVARAHQSVQLLLELGYSPKRLGSFLFRRFLPLLCVALGLAMLLATGVQAGASLLGARMQLSLPFLPGWPMWVVSLACIAILLLQMKAAVGKALRRI